MVRASAKGSEQGPGSSNMPPPYDESASTGSGAGAVPDPGAIPVIMPGDTVIAVMGVTGAGKSKFISHFSAKAKPGDDLESCTQEVEIHESYVDGQKLFLIDTPGFDDTNRSDTEILRNIANWLNVACQNQVLLSGIVYLHRIQDNRLTGAAMKNLRMFKKLCGERFLPCVVLATTMWGNVPRDVAERREADLVSKKEFWADMVRAGSRVFRQDRDAESASAIVRHIMHNRAQIKLKIQEEMEAGANLGDTDAGREVHAEMEKLRRQHAEEMRSLRDDMAEAMRKGNLEAQEEIRQVRAEMERKMEQERAAAEALRVTADELQRERERELAEQAREWREKEFEFQQRMWEKASELEKERLRNEHAARIREMEYKAKLAENEAEWLRKQNKKDDGDCLVM